jgi:phage terminase large subunit
MSTPAPRNAVAWPAPPPPYVEEPEVPEVQEPAEFAVSVTRPDGTVEILYKPLPHQAAFHAATEPNVLSLGSRGTGKSLMLRWDAILRCLTWPDFRALVLRRSYPELRRSHLMDIEREVKALGGYFHRTNNVAHFQNGSTITFAAVEDDAAILNFLSSQFGAVYYDELSTFTEQQFLQISSSARAPEAAPYVAVVRAGSNPLGVGAAWMKARFVDKTLDFEVAPDYNPADYVTLFSTLADNPHLDVAAYRKRLADLPAHVRKAWLDGEFSDEGAYFSDFRPTKDGEPYHVIETLPTVKGKPLLEQPWITIYRAVDWGYDPDPAVCLWIAVLPSGRAIVFKEQSWIRTTAQDVAKEIAKASKGMRVIETVHDPSMAIDGRGSGVSIADYFEQNGVPMTPSRNDRAGAGFAIHEWLNTVIDGEPKLQLLRTGCPTLIRTLPEMQRDKRDPAKIANGFDHFVITLGYFAQSDIVPSREPIATAAPWLRRTTPTRTRLGAESARRSV